MNARRLHAPPSAVRNLRPMPACTSLGHRVSAHSKRCIDCGERDPMPGVVLYDHEADPDDVPVLPDLVALALSVLLRSVDVPGSVSRPHACEASAIVRGHFRVGADDAPVHGYPRPVTA